MPLPTGPLVAFYGDDFTGSAATLEAMAFAGLKSILLFEIPSAEQLLQNRLRGWMFICQKFLPA
jgi:3-oxoisoapionate kinase